MPNVCLKRAGDICEGDDMCAEGLKCSCKKKCINQSVQEAAGDCAHNILSNGKKRMFEKPFPLKRYFDYKNAKYEVPVPPIINEENYSYYNNENY